MQDIVLGAPWMVCALVQQSLSDGSKERRRRDGRQGDSKTERETIMGCASAVEKGTHKGSFRGAIEIRCYDLRTGIL